MITDGYRKGSFLTRWIKALALKLVIFLAVVGAIIAFCLHGFSAFGLVFDPFHRLAHRAAAAEVKAGNAHADALRSDGQAQAGIAALAAYDQQQARGRRTDQTHQENARALLASPGAAGALDPALARTFLDGLCKYHAYDEDPGCGELRRPAGTAAPPDAGSAQAQP